jgi:hypothetical protein
MTAEKTNIKFKLPLDKKLTALDKAIRKSVVRRPMYLEDAINYVRSKGLDKEIENAVVNELSAYPSNVIDNMFPHLDKIILRNELAVSRKNNELRAKVQKLKLPEKKVATADDLYEEISQETEVPVVEAEQTVVQKEPLQIDVQAAEVEVSNPSEEFVPDPNEDSF